MSTCDSFERINSAMGSESGKADDDCVAQDTELRLGPVQAMTPSEVFGEAEPHMLPLTDSEKRHVENIIAKKARKRFSLAELFLLTTVASLLVWFSRMTSLSVYTTFVGFAAVLLQLGFFDRLISREYCKALFVILLMTYLATAAWLTSQLV